jgi:hypothetical protein
VARKRTRIRSNDRGAFRYLSAALLLAGCPAAPPLSVPPTEEIYAPGPAVEERSLPAAGSERGGFLDGGSVLVTEPSGVPNAAGWLGAGEACYDGGECQSGVCEGEGCKIHQPGRCAPAERTCSAGEAEFCGCDGETFRAPGDCPGQPYARRGPCMARPARPR